MINSEVYETLGENWYQAHDNPVALLRAESNFRNPWIWKQIRKMFPRFKKEKPAMLDIGCGGGFLSNFMAAKGLPVTGVDLSEQSLHVARRHDQTGKVKYVKADAVKLPFPNESFEIACAMDFLEHVDKPADVVAEAARVLKPGGYFFFYTFNRNWLSNLVVIKGVEWFVKNTPKDLHVHHMFVKPEEMVEACQKNGFEMKRLLGVRPKLGRAFFKMLFTGAVPENFEFKFVPSLAISYLGVARKI